MAKNITQTAGVTNIVINNVFKLILNQTTMRKNKSLYDSDLIKFDSISRERSCTSKIDALNFEVGSLKSEVGSRKAEVGSRKSEVESRKSDVGSRKSEVGSPSSACRRCSTSDVCCLLNSLNGKNSSRTIVRDIFLFFFLMLGFKISYGEYFLSHRLFSRESGL